LIADRELSGSQRVILTLAASLCSLSFTFSLNDVVCQLDEADIEIAPPGPSEERQPDVSLSGRPPIARMWLWSWLGRSRGSRLRGSRADEM
jgi:hypothetical protein